MYKVVVMWSDLKRKTSLFFFAFRLFSRAWLPKWIIWISKILYFLPWNLALLEFYFLITCLSSLLGLWQMWHRLPVTHFALLQYDSLVHLCNETFLDSRDLSSVLSCRWTGLVPGKQKQNNLSGFPAFLSPLPFLDIKNCSLSVRTFCKKGWNIWICIPACV